MSLEVRHREERSDLMSIVCKDSDCKGPHVAEALAEAQKRSALLNSKVSKVEIAAVVPPSQGRSFVFLRHCKRLLVSRSFPMKVRHRDRVPLKL